MNPYEVNYNKLKESEDPSHITDPKFKIKLCIVKSFLESTSHMSNKEIIEKTKIDKSDLSRIRALNIKRYSIDRLIGILIDLGFKANFSITPKLAS